MAELDPETVHKMAIAVSEPSTRDWLQGQLVSWAAWLVAGLSWLLFQLTKDKLHEKEQALLAQMALLKLAVDKCITQDDFKEHEAREVKNHEEVVKRIDDNHRDLDGKVSVIMEHMMK